MKICIYNVTSTMDLPGTREVGGTEEFSFRLAGEWQNQGHQVEIVGGEPRPGASTRPTQVPLRLFPYRETAEFPNLGTRFRKLAQRCHFAVRALRYVAGERFDLVLAMKPYDLLPLFAMDLKSRSRVLLRFGGTDFFPGDRLWAGAADHLFANSPQTAQKVTARYQAPCRVISNGVAVPARAAESAAGRLRLVSVGRLVGWKGFDTLIQALSPLRNRKHLSLTIVGDGEERHRLESLAGEFGLSGIVTFPGRLSEKEIGSLLLEGGLYIQPSVGFDSCPNAVMEAMAAALPVAISSQVGRLEGFEAGRHGVVFKAGDSQSLCEVIAGYLADPARWVRWGRSARALIAERHTIDRVARQILELAGT